MQCTPRAKRGHQNTAVQPQQARRQMMETNERDDASYI